MDIKDLTDRISNLKVSDIVAAVKEWDRQTWIYVGSGTVIFLLFFAFLFVPAWCKRPVLNKQCAEASAQMARLKVLNAKKPQLEAQKKEIQELMTGFQAKLFSNEEASLLLGKLSKLAQDAQVDLLSSHPVEGSEPFPAPYSSKYSKYVYQITVEAPYHSLGALVGLIEAYPRYLQVQSLDIVPQVNKQGRLVADIKIMAVSQNALPTNQDVSHAAAK